MIPLTLGESVATMTSLMCLFFRHSEMTFATCQKLMLGLSTCLALEHLSFSNCKLTNNIRNLIGPGHPGFKSLLILVLHNTGLSEDNVDSLAMAVKQQNAKFEVSHVTIKQTCWLSRKVGGNKISIS